MRSGFCHIFSKIVGQQPSCSTFFYWHHKMLNVPFFKITRTLRSPVSKITITLKSSVVDEPWKILMRPIRVRLSKHDYNENVTAVKCSLLIYPSKFTYSTLLRYFFASIDLVQGLTLMSLFMGTQKHLLVQCSSFM